MDLFGHCISYITDPELQARRFLMDEMIRAEGYAGLHAATRGRKPWPTHIMVRAMYVQKEEGWSDRTMESQLKDNRRVRYLVGLPLDGPSPSRSALLDFRQRLLQAEQHLLAFQQQQEFLARSGLVQQTDGTIIDSTPQATAAAQPTVVGLLQHGMRRVFLNWRGVDPPAAAAAAARLHMQAWLAKRFNRCCCGLRSRQGRRLWDRDYGKAGKLLKMLPTEVHGHLQEARNLLQRIMAERGPDGTLTPPDRITNAMDSDARFGCKGEGSHRHTWQGYKVTIVTHAPTDLILSLDVMTAQHVDGDALLPAVDAMQPVYGRMTDMDADGAYTDEMRRWQMSGRGICITGPRRTAKRPGPAPGGGRVATKADRGRRSRVEHVHAHLTRWRHNRRCPYLGLRKAWLQSALAVCAANLVRLVTLWREGRLVLPGLATAA